jgi:DNA-binding beta-propeller fold protein YncE
VNIVRGATCIPMVGVGEEDMATVIAYVVSGSGGSPTVVTPVDTVTDTAGAPIVIAKGGQSIAARPNGKTVYVPIISLKAVIPIRTATNMALAPIPVGSEPFAIVVTPNGRTAYVGNTSVPSSVTPIRLSTNSPLATSQ